MSYRLLANTINKILHCYSILKLQNASRILTNNITLKQMSVFCYYFKVERDEAEQPV